MRLEGERRRRTALLSSSGPGGIEQTAVSQVDAVEVSDGDGAAGQSSDARQKPTLDAHPAA